MHRAIHSAFISINFLVLTILRSSVSLDNLCYVKFLTSDIIGRLDISFRRKEFWDSLGGQALLIIGLWLPWIPSTNHK